MKVCKTDVNKISLHSIILQLQLTLELSQFKEILSVYSDLLVLVANYSFIFENSSSEIQALKENPVSVETALITQDPIRDGINWYAYCGGDPINYIDENGLETTDKKKPAIYPTAGNAFNLDFGRDYSNMAVQNFKNGHPILGTIQMLDSACEIVYDLAAAYGCAQGIGAAIEGVTALVSTGSVNSGIETIKNYGPMNKGPLPDGMANTFRGGSYSQVTLQSDLTLYRVYGGTAEQLGSYWTKTAPTGPLQSTIDLALKPEWGNTAENVVKINVPAGTTIFEGFAESQGGFLLGGGSQVVIPNVDPGWVVK